MRNHNAEIVHVPFDDYTIAAVSEGDDIKVPLKPLCDKFGLDFSAQLKRLKKSGWATVAVVATVAKDGRIREVTTIDLESVSMWASGIRVDHVYPELRDKLVKFQRESRSVLAAWHQGYSPSIPGLAESFAELKRDHDALVANLQVALKMITVEVLKGREFERKLNSAMVPFQAGGEAMTLREYHAAWPILDVAGRPIGEHEMAGIGRSLSAYCRARGVEPGRATGELHHTVNSYPLGTLQAWRARRDEQLMRQKAEYRAPKKPSQGTLF